MRYSFENGYGASVITNGYGSKEGLEELAVMHNGRLCYKTPITDDVMGYLTQGEVNVLLEQIKALPEQNLCNHVRKN